MALVENIKALCSQNGLSVLKLEKELRFGRGSIYNWDKNSPSVDKVQKVAKYFKVSLNHVLKGVDPTKNTSPEDDVNHKVEHQISRNTLGALDPLDSRLLKKEILRIVRVRKSILQSLCESDVQAYKHAFEASKREGDDPFLSSVERLIWQWVAIRLASDLKCKNEGR
ncbi:hypothetical protein GCM10023310_00550 [Paenibacillus vulneris]|uniref:Helix-turn-helix domain-containing protein n=1 Tax=Paenibacillus vulneris TaxID=1133364 RepID=A0ABW3UXB6_9BACL